ncbi:MAG: hypothetical protein ACXVCP_06905 [Bdellovibrio sp.]
MKKISLLIMTVIVCLCLMIIFSNSHEIVFESMESKSLNNAAVYNKIKWFNFANKDVWMMNQSHDGLSAQKWDRLAIVIDKTQTPKLAKFYQLEPGALEWSEGLKEVPLRVSCFMCHPNGPRVIRPNLDSSTAPLPWQDRIKLSLWNLKIKSYGRLKTSAPSYENLKAVPFRWPDHYANEPLTVKTCTKCHKESGLFARGTLLRQNILTVKFMVEKGLMPPLGMSLSNLEKSQLEKFIAGF